MPVLKLFRSTCLHSSQSWSSKTHFNSGFWIRICICLSNSWLTMLGYWQHRLDLHLKAMISNYLDNFLLIGSWTSLLEIAVHVHIILCKFWHSQLPYGANYQVLQVPACWFFFWQHRFIHKIFMRVSVTYVTCNTSAAKANIRQLNISL